MICIGSCDVLFTRQIVVIRSNLTSSKGEAMSVIEKFGDAVKASEGLQEKIKAAGTDLAEIVKIANEAGFVLTEDELKAHADGKKGEMSDEDLEQVSGGALVVTYVAVVAV